MLLSFIIPLYNCEEYIAHSLDTILGSQLPKDDYEIIVINDESKDRGPEICLGYAETNKNIHLYHQKNDGPSTARNLGLQHAQGDFIWFIDADDLIEPKMIPVLLQTIQEHPNVELISFAYIEQYPDKEILHRRVETQKVCSGLEFLKINGGGYLWNHLYSRQSIGNHRFVNGVRHIEDTCFNMQTVIDFKKVIMLPDVGYYYNRKNIHSISHDKRLRDRVKANEDSYIVYNAIYQKLKETTDEEKKAFLNKVLNFSIAAHLYTMMRFDNVRTIKRHIDAYREMGFYPLKRTGNRKSDLFIRLANHESILLCLKKAGILTKRLIQR